MTRFNLESELAAVVVEDLESSGYTVRKEVRLGEYGQGAPIVDIVAEKGSKLWAIETKLSLSLDVVCQAHRLTGMFHQVSVAVPRPMRHQQNKSNARMLLLRAIGVGMSTVKETSVRHSLAPRFFEPDGSVYQWLTEAQLTSVAGSSGGGYDTRFKQYVRRLEDFIRANPGCSLHEMTDSDNVEPHYANPSTARQCIKKYIRTKVIKTIEAKGCGISRGYYIKEGVSV